MTTNDVSPFELAQLYLRLDEALAVRQAALVRQADRPVGEIDLDVVGLYYASLKAVAAFSNSNTRALAKAVIEQRAELERFKVLCRELDKLSLVFESAVRNADLPNRPAVVALIKANREALRLQHKEEAENV
jgi:hypothetical protein